MRKNVRNPDTANNINRSVLLICNIVAVVVFILEKKIMINWNVKNLFIIYNSLK